MRHGILRKAPATMPPSSLVITASSLEDRVRMLCDRAIAAKTQAKLDAVLPALKASIRDHIRYLRAIAVEVIPEAFGRDNNVAD